MISQLLLHSIRVRFFFIHLINSYNKRCSSCFRVLYRFNCLGHHTIICSNRQNNNIGNLSTSRTHFSKRSMAWCIQEGNFTSTCIYLISTNVLCNTSCFARSNFCTTNIIKQGCLTMINMSHHRHNWCSDNKNTLIFI